MSDRSITEIEAELRAARLAEELVEAKGTDAGPTDELKADLREARKAYREARAERAAGPGAARPDTIETTAEAAELGA